MQPTSYQYLTSGYVSSNYTVGDPQLWDDPLDDLIHDHIMNVTGIAGGLIRPRFQPEPATHPDFTANWVAFGISSYDADTFAYVSHDPLGNGGLGTNTVERDEIITLKLSFYGPNNAGLISQYREGVQLDFNRWDLDAAGVKFIAAGQVINLPALLKDRWVKRLDLSCTFRRRVSRTYNVPSLLGGNLVLHNEWYDTTIPTSVP